MLHLQFAKCNALCISSLGYIVFICNIKSGIDVGPQSTQIFSLELFSLKGIHLGTKVLKSLKRIPHTLSAIADGHSIMVCGNDGISFYKLSAITPLDIVDVWCTTKVGDFHRDVAPSTFDVDLGPYLSSPFVTIAGCSSGAVKLGVLKGITNWNEANKKKIHKICCESVFQAFCGV